MTNVYFFLFFFLCLMQKSTVNTVAKKIVELTQEERDNGAPMSEWPGPHPHTNDSIESAQHTTSCQQIKKEKPEDIETRSLLVKDRTSHELTFGIDNKPESCRRAVKREFKSSSSSSSSSDSSLPDFSSICKQRKQDTNNDDDYYNTHNINEPHTIPSTIVKPFTSHDILHATRDPIASGNDIPIQPPFSSIMSGNQAAPWETTEETIGEKIERWWGSSDTKHISHPVPITS